jgi:hypothetical protein
MPVTEASDIAVIGAEQQSDGNNCVQPAGGISRANRAGSLTVNGSGVTECAWLERS